MKENRGFKVDWCKMFMAVQFLLTVVLLGLLIVLSLTGAVGVPACVFLLTAVLVLMDGYITVKAIRSLRDEASAQSPKDTAFLQNAKA